MENEFANLGFQFNPFEHLDASGDRRLHDYLVIPTRMDIAWGDAPAAVFALPGGGKSALRIYTEKIYQGSRGVKFPITCIPGTYSMQPDYYEMMLKHAIARAVFIYLFSYPRLLSEFSPDAKNQIASILGSLPFPLPFVLSMIKSGGQIKQLEKLLGVHALSGIQNFDQSHLQLADRLLQANPENKSLEVETCFDLIKGVLGAQSIHILLDGLDGFPETANPSVLIEWIDPLLKKVDKWAEQGIYLKFFLPLESNQLAGDRQPHTLKSEILTWDNDLLAALIHRRLYIASNGHIGSLDAISAPGLSNVELQIASQLPPRDRLPRQMIKQTRSILLHAVKEPDGLIRAKHLKEVWEESYAPIA